MDMKYVSVMLYSFWDARGKPSVKLASLSFPITWLNLDVTQRHYVDIDALQW